MQSSGTTAHGQWIDVELTAGTDTAIGTDVRGPSPRGQLHLGPSGWTLHLVDLPTPDAEAIDTGRRLVEAAATAVAHRGGGRVHLWARAQDPLLAAVADAAGMQATRDLWQMRRPLPVGEAWSIDVRPFHVGTDEQAWLEVNNRAFAWHPEQGHRSMAELQQMEQEPWFDPEGFLLHQHDGRLAGFCWTKVHHHETPPLGEIYVIAVDPAAHQRGLGRQLVLAGLDHLHGRGLSWGMLYVEATNEPATHLYRSLGFDVHQVDTAHTLEVPPR